MFVFSLGVGYQRLESNISAADADINARLDKHIAEVSKEREYIQSDLQEIKAKLYDIERYLREKR